MKKRLISITLSSFMFISMFSTAFSEKVQAVTSNNDNSKQCETGLIAENKEGQEWLDKNAVKINSEEQLDEIVGTGDKQPDKLPKAASKARIQEESLPSSVDNSTSKYFPAVASQVGGSCTGYSIGYYLMTYEYNKYHDTTPTEDKNIMSPRWCYNLANGGVDKGSGVSNILGILKRNGIANIKDVPMSYKGSSANNYHYDYYARDNVYENALKNRISDFYYVTVGNKGDDTPITAPNDSDLDLLKSTLARGKILTFSTYISSFRYSTIRDGYDYAGESIITGCYGKSGHHEMTIVGYDDNIWVDIDGDNEVDEGEKGAIKIVNSWGKNYGNSGFVWVSYDALNNKSCVKSTDKSSRIGVLENYIAYGVNMEDTSKNDEFYLELDLNTSLRNTVSVSFNSNNEDRQTTVLTPMFDRYGGSYGYDGTTNSTDGKFIFDLSEYNKEFTKEMILREGLKVNISDHEKDGVYLTVKNVALVDRSNNQRISLLDKNVKLDGRTLELYSKESDRGIPTNFKANINEDNHAELSWDKPQDDIKYYKIYKDSQLIGITEGTTFTDESDLNGEYKYSIRAVYNDGEISRKVSEEVDNSYCKIYYRNNNYNSAYIHFRIDNDNWTTASGKEMTKSANKDGYYEYKIELREHTGKSEVEACFNNGSGSWDNNNSKNYFFKKGTYILENGTINEEHNKLKINDLCISKKSPMRLGESVIICPNISGGSGKYNVRIKIKPNYGASQYYWNQEPLVWVPENAGYYTISCSVYDEVTSESASFDDIEILVKNKEDLKINNIDFDENSQIRNSKIAFAVNTSADNVENNYLLYDVSVIKPDGSKEYVSRDGYDGNRFTYNNTNKEGIYTFYVNVKNKNTGEEVNKTFTYEIKDGQLSVSSFKTQKVDNTNEDITEVKASDNYSLVPYVIGGVGEYTYKYGYYFDGKYYEIEDNNSNSLVPRLETPGEYKFMVTVKDEVGNTAVAYKNLTITQGDLELLNPESDKTTIKMNDIVNLKFKCKYSLGSVQYKVIEDDEVIRDFSYDDTFKYEVKKGVYHKLTIEAKDARGISSYNYFYIFAITDPIVIDTFEAKEDTIALGESFIFNIKLSGGYGEKHYYLSAIDEDGKYTYISTNNTEQVIWKPSKAGKYQIELGCYDEGNNYTNKSIEVNVTEPVKLTTTTIYYKGYDNPYIHYRIGNGQWTVAPGVKMESNSDVDGYNYAITVDLKDADKLEACFNNGKGEWDSNGTKNYTFGTGYYTYSNGVITQIEKPTKELKIKSLTSSLGDTFEKDKTTQLSINATGENVNNYSIKVNGEYILYKSNSNTVSWTPTEAGKYEITAYASNAQGESVSYTKTITVEEKSLNNVTIYYKGYDNPYIHYRIGNGQWTVAPGVKMESNSDVAGYNYAITINLKDADKLEACFNNGNGVWDSNNGRNYIFEVGNYTYSNGKINKIN